MNVIDIINGMEFMVSPVIAELYQKAQLAIYERQYELAHNCLVSLLAADNYFADAYFLLARIAHEYKNFEKEVELLLTALSLDADNAEYCAYLAKAYAVKGDVHQALTYAARFSELQNHTALSFDTLGVVYNRLGMYAEASHFFQKAIELEKNNPAIYFNLGSTLKFCGDFSGATTAYQKAIALNPSYYKAHAALTSLGGITAEKNHVNQLKKLLPDAKNADNFLHVSHAISKELEAIGQFDQAFQFLRDGKQRKLCEINYDVQNDIDIFSGIKNFFKNKKVNPDCGCEVEGPIFVVGMPRSGTTLVERVISNHNNVATAGELHNFSMGVKKIIGSRANGLFDKSLLTQLNATGFEAFDFKTLGKDYLASTAHLKNDRKFLVDKLPLNVLYAGFIVNAMPRAKIICLDRNPLDTIVSNFRQLFSLYDATYAYSLDLSTAALYYIEFKRLKDFWAASYPNNFYVINYENLVRSPEEEIKKLLEFCSLDWQIECMRIENNKNPVATASSVQVRMPISDKSVGQWKNYESHLDNVKQILRGCGVTF